MKSSADGHLLGRLYYRPWLFGGEAETIDWNVNLQIGDPKERGKTEGGGIREPFTPIHTFPHPGGRRELASPEGEWG